MVEVLDKSMKAKKEIEVIAARHISAKTREDLLNQISSLLKQSDQDRVSAGLQALERHCVQEKLPQSQSEDCWLTLSKEMDGITYLDIYQTG